MNTLTRKTPRQARGIMFGDYKAMYHPLEPMGRQLRQTLSPVLATLTLTDDHTLLEGKALAEYALCIAYFEVENNLTRAQAEGLMAYVRGGGALLALHNGISFQDPLEAPPLAIRFTGHPPYEAMPFLQFTSDAQPHEIMEGIASFSLPEEAYMFDIHTPQGIHPFLWYAYEGQRYPAGWATPCGLGKIAYLTPGHSQAALENSTFASLLQKAASWCISKEA